MNLRVTGHVFTAAPLPLLRRGVGLGFLIVICGGWLLLRQLLAIDVSAGSRIQDALFGGLIAASATALGTLPVLLSQGISQRTSDTLLGFGAGVMLAATAFSLIIPALGAAHAQGMGRWSTSLVVAAGISLGGLSLLLVDRWLPGHGVLVRPGVSEEAARALRRAWGFVAAIAPHNLPEGLAIGVAFAGTDPAQARALTAGISIQNVPDGLVVALALRSVGVGRLTAVAAGVVSCLTRAGSGGGRCRGRLGSSGVTLGPGLRGWRHAVRRQP